MKSARPEAVFDTEGLQADVMRFMAIIAFCLIAVMSLVQQLPATTPVTPDTPTPDTSSPNPNLVEPEQDAVIEPDPMVETLPLSPPENTTAPLTLRFASERAFLTLIDTGRITLFARTSDGFVTVTPGFRVETAPATGVLYEVIDSSLPDSIRRLLPGTDLFLVRLPDDTARRLDELHSRYAASGGELVIQQSGSLTYEEI